MSATVDSQELEDLFDSISRGASGASAGPVAPDESADVVNRVGKLTRQLHDTLSELGLDKHLHGAASAMPDAKERLNYVVKMTEEAAVRTLGAVEAAQPLQDELALGANELSARWERLKRGELDVEAFKQLADDNHAFLKALPDSTKAVGAKLREIVMAQEFQDLTGQVIKKITEAVTDLEQQLLALLLDNVPPDKRQEASGLLNGPAISGGAGVVTSQAQVDDLLESLGF